MSDPRWSDETEQLVAEATEKHHLVNGQTDAMGNSPCVCGKWWDAAGDNPGWDQHMAEVTLTALADAGLLVPASASEVVVHPSYLANDNIRVNLGHPTGACRWSVAFAAQPTNRVPLLDLIREVHRHDARCIAAPTTPGSPK